MVLRASKRRKPEDAKVRQRHLTTLGGYFARELARLKRPFWLSVLTGFAAGVIVYIGLWFTCQMTGKADIDNTVLAAFIVGLVIYADMRRPL